jgi:hypothetical protein
MPVDNPRGCGQVPGQEAFAAVLVLELLDDESDDPDPEEPDPEEPDEEVFDDEPESEEDPLDPDELDESPELEDPEPSEEVVAAASTRPPARLSVR